MMIFQPSVCFHLVPSSGTQEEIKAKSNTTETYRFGKTYFYSPAF